MNQFPWPAAQHLQAANDTPIQAKKELKQKKKTSQDLQKEKISQACRAKAEVLAESEQVNMNQVAPDEKGVALAWLWQCRKPLNDLVKATFCVHLD